MHIVMTYNGAMADWAKKFDAIAGGEGRAKLAAALNEAGHAIREDTVSAETGQTGLTHGTIDKAQHTIDAGAGSLSFTIVSKGGNVRLKFFGAKESGGGVNAHPWNSGHFYQGAFTHAGGGFGGARVALPWGGEVKQRKGSSRLPIHTVKSGLYIPTEMVSGKTAGAFNAWSAAAPNVIVSKLGSLLP